MIMKNCLFLMFASALTFIKASEARIARFGVNGHPIVSSVYGLPGANDPLRKNWVSVDVDKQLVPIFQPQFQALKKSNLSVYRVDVPLANDRPDIVPYLSALVKLGRTYGVRIKPIIQIPATWNTASTDGCGGTRETNLMPDETCFYAKTFDRVRKIVEQFYGDIPDWELENELDLASLKVNGDGSGRLIQDYDPYLI